MKNSLALSILCFSMLGCNTRESQLQKALSFDVKHFKENIVLKDDDLDLVAKFSTVNGFREKRGLLGIVWDDNFLRGFVDKKTGERAYQVYNVIYYYDSNWRDYFQVNYETPNGPNSKPLYKIGHDVDCSSHDLLGCRYEEHVAFDVEEEVLRRVATEYVPGRRRAWRYKLIPMSGEDYQDGILPAEVAAIVEIMDEYTAKVLNRDQN